MDQAEAKALGLDFKDVMALESSGMNIPVMKKFIVGCIDVQQIKLEKQIKDEYDKKIKDLTNNQSKMLSKLQPVQELTQNGKSLPMAILEYIMSSNGIAAIIDKARGEIIESKQMEAKFVTLTNLSD